MTTLVRYEISTTASQPKAFSLQEADDKISEFVSELKREGLPHLCSFHTHSAPPANAHLTYLEEFDLAPEFRKLQNRAACPCCDSTRPRFFRVYISYCFEDGCVRCVGRNCYKRLNPEGEKKAIRDLRARKARRATVRYLLDNLGNLPKIVVAIRSNFGIAIDQLRYSLHQAPLQKTVDALWNAVRDNGQLCTITNRKVISHNSHGSPSVRTHRERLPFRPLPGYRVLEPGGVSLAAQISTAITDLEKLQGVPSDEETIKNLQDVERNRIAAKFSQAIESADSVRKKIIEMLEFVGPVAVANLRIWGGHPNAEVPIEIHRQGLKLKIGLKNRSVIEIRLSAEIDLYPNSTPILGADQRASRLSA